MERGAVAFLADIFNAGRKVRGEHLAFREYRSAFEAYEVEPSSEDSSRQGSEELAPKETRCHRRLRIPHTGMIGEKKLFLSDRLLLNPGRYDYSGMGFFESFSTSATLYLIFQDPGLASDLAGLFQTILEEKNSEDILGSASLLPDRGLVVRILGRETYEVERLVLDLWLLARRKVLLLESPFIHRLFQFLDND